MLAKTFSVDDSFDFEENNLTSELRILQMTLPDISMSAMEILSLLGEWIAIPIYFLFIRYYLLYQ
jgi:hypothetical protein